MRLLWRLARLLAILLVIALGLSFGKPYLLRPIGSYLITEKPLVKADIILVLAGQPVLRVPEGARVYHEGFAPRILLTNEPKQRGSDDLLRAGIRFPEGQEKALTILEALRVPRSAILTIQERTNSTEAEMESVARFLRSHRVQKLIIVTSKSHTTRAQLIFSTGLGPGVQVITHPVPSDPFDPNGWWKDRTDTKEVLHEYGGLVAFWWMRLWRLATGGLTTPPPSVTIR